MLLSQIGRESVLINIEDYAKYEEFMHQRYVAEELALQKQQAADPNTQWTEHGKRMGDAPMNSMTYKIKYLPPCRPGLE